MNENHGLGAAVERGPPCAPGFVDTRSGADRVGENRDSHFEPLTSAPCSHAEAARWSTILDLPRDGPVKNLAKARAQDLGGCPSAPSGADSDPPTSRRSKARAITMVQVMG